MSACVYMCVSAKKRHLPPPQCPIHTLHKHAYVSIYLYIYMYVCMYVCIHTYIHTYIHLNVHIHKHKHIHVYVHRHLHIHRNTTHTHTHNLPLPQRVVTSPRAMRRSRWFSLSATTVTCQHCYQCMSATLPRHSGEHSEGLFFFSKASRTSNLPPR